MNESEIAYSLILRLQYDKLVLEGKLQEALEKLAAAEARASSLEKDLAEREAALADAETRRAQQDGGPSLGRAV